MMSTHTPARDAEKLFGTVDLMTADLTQLAPLSNHAGEEMS